MALNRNPWLLALYPVVGLLVAWSLSHLIVWQYESVWRKSKSELVAEELQFYCRLVESARKSATEVIELANDSGEGQLMLVPDREARATENQFFDRPAIEWFVEPDGFRRVRAVRHVTPRESAPGWVVFSRRVPPIDRESYRWVVWLFPIGFLSGLMVALRLWQQVQRRERTLRSLQSLRVPLPSTIQREVMMQLFPDSTFSNEINRELISVLESYQSQYADIQSGAEQSQSVLSAMPVGILAFSSDLRLTYANRAGSVMLELSEPVRLYSRLIELIRQPKVIEVVTESQHQRQTLDSELERPADDTVLRLRAYPLLQDAAASYTSSKPPMLLIVTDETRLRQLENARRDFTANVSHELKTPLAAIKAYAETLLMGAIDDPDAKERFVTRISEQAARLDNLIRDLLQLTKIQSLPERLSLNSMSVSEILRTSAEEHQQIAASREVQLLSQPIPTSLRVMGEYEALRTILSNLLTNAIRYSKPGGRVEMRATARESIVEISVVDNGIGIPEPDLERIFERFYRVDKARSQDAGGTGLGLSIVKYLVQALGGSITVRSILGEGSEFTIRLEQDKSETGSTSS